MSRHKPGLVRRFFRWLFSPSARLSVFVLLLAGVIVGAGGVIATEVMVQATGTNAFCGGACHSMKAFVLPEFQESAHYANRSGVPTQCGDCHIPHAYPQKLIYKAQAGIRDIYKEITGSISTQEKYEKERWRMANKVWEEMRANNSANCRYCHDDKAMAASKQSPIAQKMHQQFRAGKATCIDCHKGIAHKEPEEPAAPAEPAKMSALGAN